MNDILIEILVGLPGSGKTYYSREHGATNNLYNTKVSYISFDDYFVSHPSNFNYADCLRRNNMGYNISREKINYNHWILDGLFLTHKDQIQIVHDIYGELKHYNLLNQVNITIKFVYFKENRETCLFNDSFRDKNRQAKITIKYNDFDKPDIKRLKAEFNNFKFTITEMEVHKMNTYESLFKLRESSLHNNMMCSDEWCLGGTWGDCWGNSGNISADDQPTEFTKFDELLTEICPNVTMLQYKKLYRECVTTKIRQECDYYGGVCEYARYECNLRKLYEMMVEMNLVKED